MPGIGSESNMESATILPFVSASANSGALSPTAGAPAAAGNWREAYNVAYAKSPAAPKLSNARIGPKIFPRYSPGFAKALRTPTHNRHAAAANISQLAHGTFLVIGNLTKNSR